MLVKAKIIDCDTRTHKQKQVADISLKFSDPAEAVTITLWNNSVAANEHLPFFEAAGKEVMVSITPRVWNGNLQYNLNSSVKPIVLTPAKQPSQAGK